MQRQRGPSETGPLRVRLLGGFEIEGIDERSLGSRKARTLLRRLAVARGRPVAAGELADAVWGDDLPRDPGDQLSVLVSRLRSVLGSDRLRRGDAGYWLAVDWIDIVELRTRTAEAESRLSSGQRSTALAAAQAALAIVHGRLLPEDDAAWADDARATVERDVGRARLIAAEAALAVGDTFAAGAAAAAALDADPCDEAALRVLMRADVAAGRQAAALIAYKSLRARLADELGVDPAPETQALHVAVLKGQVPSARAAAVEPELVGRRRELERLDATLARARTGASVAVVVDGDPGIGKSALLRAWSASALGAACVVAGRCDELGRDLPLQPVVDGLAVQLRTLVQEQAAGVLGDRRDLLEGLLGLGGPPVAAGSAVTIVVDSSASRLALFGALAGALERLAAGRPLVLAIDDLHAAAPGTLEFLGFVLRRLGRVAVVAARRPSGRGAELPWTDRIELGPLSLDDAAALVGTERSAALHERSGGHPLFLLELARAGDGRLPGSIVDAVGARVAALGAAAATVQVAAVLGPLVDVDLLASVVRTPIPAVLDALERAADAGLLTPRGEALAFTHELVREAVEAATSPARRALLHRTAAMLLATRPGADPLLVASHARRAADPALASSALLQAARLAAERFDTAAAEALLDDAVAFDDTSAARLARGRLRMGRLDLAGARDDAARALELGAGAQAFELAGWVEYYMRDYEAARRFADEGVDRAEDDATRASCLALGGRIRHTRGELATSAAQLARAVELAPPAVRGLAQVWQAQLLAHMGRAREGVEMARRALLDPRVGHPFAPLHGRFTLAMSLALLGSWAEALEAVDDLDAATTRLGDQRFPPIAANVRGWLLRGAGLVDEARELHRWAESAASSPLFLEPHYVGLLDLCDDCLAAGDLAEAERALARCASIVDWHGSMSWRQRERYRLALARLALAGGDAAAAEELAAAVAAAAAERGNPRYECRAVVVRATARARSGRPVDEAALASGVERLLPLAGPDGWRDLAALAAATRSDRWQRCAEDLAGRVVEGARRRDGIDADRVAAALRAALDSGRA